MRETLDRMLATAREYWAKMPRRSRIRVGILAGIVVVLAIVIVSLLSRTQWVAISNTDDVAKTNDIVATLGGSGIRTRREGNLVEVPEQSVSAAQAVLFEYGLVGTPVFDSSIMEGAASFSVSSEHANELYDMQTADNIRVMLLQNPKVQNAFVIINRGESSPFRIQTNTRKATASVQLTLIDGEVGLTKGEAQSVADTVKGAVQGIEYEDIYITDNLYNTYTLGDELENMELQYNQRIALQNRLTEQAKSQAERLLTPIYGPDNFQIQPYIRLNFDNVVINKVEFDPPIPGNEEGMLRSAERIFEMQRNWANAEGIPGTDTNGMGVAEYPWGAFDNDDIYRRDVEQLNYELNETRTAIEVANGTIEQFGISVLVNKDYYHTGLEEEEIEPPEEYIEEVTDLLSKGLGVAAGNISVQYVPYSYRDTSYEDYLAALAAKEEQERRDMWIDRIFMYGTILLLGIMVFLLVRSILNSMRPPPEPEVILTADGPSIDLDQLIAEEEAAALAAAEAAAAEAEKALPGPEDIDLNAKSPVLEQIGKFIEKDPAAVAQLLRNWLSDEM